MADRTVVSAHRWSATESGRDITFTHRLTRSGRVLRMHIPLPSAEADLISCIGDSAKLAELRALAAQVPRPGIARVGGVGDEYLAALERLLAAFDLPADDLGARYYARMTRPVELTGEDEEMIAGLLRQRDSGAV